MECIIIIIIVAIWFEVWATWAIPHKKSLVQFNNNGNK